MQLAELSVHHNIFLTSSGNNVILIWSYEFGKLIGQYELEPEEITTAIAIIHGFNIFVVSTINGSLFFIRFTLIDDDLNLLLISAISVSKSLILRAEALNRPNTQSLKDVNPSEYHL